MILRRAPFALSVLVSFVVLFSPGSDVPGAPPGVDKIVHFGLFALLAATGYAARLPAGALALALVAYAAVSEVLQAVAPIHRDGTLGDFVADTVGVLVALAAAVAVAMRLRRRGAG